MIGYTRLTAKASENQKGGDWGLGDEETVSTCTDYRKRTTLAVYSIYHF